MGCFHSTNHGNKKTKDATAAPANPNNSLLKLNPNSAVPEMAGCSFLPPVLLLVVAADVVVAAAVVVEAAAGANSTGQHFL